MAKKLTVRDRFFKKVFKELDKAYSEGLITLAYARRVLKHYGLNVGELARASAMAHRSAHIKEEKKHLMKKNPLKHKGPVRIYSNIQAIEARKGEDSLWPGEQFRHKYNEKSEGEIFGIPPGTQLKFPNGLSMKIVRESILIKSKKNKKMYDNFKYDDEVDGVDNEG